MSIKPNVAPLRHTTNQIKSGNDKRKKSKEKHNKTKKTFTNHHNKTNDRPTQKKKQTTISILLHENVNIHKYRKYTQTHPDTIRVFNWLLFFL